MLSSPLMREDYNRSLSVNEESARRPDAAGVEIGTLLERFTAARVTT